MISLRGKTDWTLFTVTVKYGLPKFEAISHNIISLNSVFDKQVWKYDNLMLGRKKNEFIEDWEYLQIPIYNKLKKLKFEQADSVKYNSKLYRRGDLLKLQDNFKFLFAPRMISRWASSKEKVVYSVKDRFFSKQIRDQSLGWRTEELYSTVRFHRIYGNWAELEGFVKDKLTNRLKKTSFIVRIEQGTLTETLN